MEDESEEPLGTVRVMGNSDTGGVGASAVATSTAPAVTTPPDPIKSLWMSPRASKKKARGERMDCEVSFHSLVQSLKAQGRGIVYMAMMLLEINMRNNLVLHSTLRCRWRSFLLHA